MWFLTLAIRVGLALISVMVGIAGLLLPILPGWPFLGLAVLLLFPNTRFSQRIFTKIETRFPTTKRFLRFLIPVAGLSSLESSPEPTKAPATESRT